MLRRGFRERIVSRFDLERFPSRRCRDPATLNRLLYCRHVPARNTDGEKQRSCLRSPGEARDEGYRGGRREGAS